VVERRLGGGGVLGEKDFEPSDRIDILAFCGEDQGGENTVGLHSAGGAGTEADFSKDDQATNC